MTEDEARALAAKREAHKSKHMKHKRWEAVHDSAKGWHAALVDVLPSPRMKQEPNALDILAALAPTLLMAKVNQALADGRNPAR